ncbi:MAG: hypothetical protein KME25_32910 [Symplocastrum torsivum CPER-KK1]|jgi:hypothetical protein|uniref:Uncharacterized protein n=1 Tax=Symplocastrum torsivum CPER-KK1 TaxID=450513 RepID=A0A951PTM8_9CYAN|nr:hypothetical protein [Symplocastrum torsivum CPER-KK1]
MCEPVTTCTLGAAALKGVAYGAGAALGGAAISEAIKAVKESSPRTTSPKAATA